MCLLIGYLLDRIGALLCHPEKREVEPNRIGPKHYSDKRGFKHHQPLQRPGEANVNRAILRSVLEKAQEELVQELCGSRYSQGGDRGFRRAGTTKRTLETRHGTVEFRLVKVRSMENWSVMRPFLLYIGLEPRRRVVDDLALECAE